MNYETEIRNHLDKNGKLKVYPSKKKYKIYALMYLISKFKKGVMYTEKEVNEILDNAHTFNDRCLLRRELFDHKFLGRLNNCSKYWVEEKQPTIDDFNFD